MTEKRYRVLWNAKIKKFQILLPGFNCAVAEFYDGSVSSAAEIEGIFKKDAKAKKEALRHEH